MFAFSGALLLLGAEKGLAAAGPPPTGFNGVAGNNGTQAQIVLTWTPSTGPATAYRIRRYTVASGGTATILNVSGGATTTYTDVGLSFNAVRYYEIATVDGTSIGSFVPSPRLAVLTVPAAPTGLARTLGNYPDVRLTWSATPGATSYRVKRSTTSGGPFTLVPGGTPTTHGTAANPFIDTTVAGNTQYYYVVSAVSLAGEGPNSAQVSALTKQGPPAGVIVAAGSTAGNGAPVLNWTAPSGPVPTSYRVYRSIINDPPTFALFQTIAGSPPATTFKDLITPTEVMAHYYVTAVGTGGESRPSSTNFAMSTHRRAPKLFISEVEHTPGPGSPDSAEWIELVATEAINFSVDHYSVVFARHISDPGEETEAGADGWIEGCNITYGFNITSGTVQRGGVVYVGGSGMTSIPVPVGTPATRVRVKNTETAAGDRFGTPSTDGVIGDGGTDADGIAVFATDIANIKSGTVPVDAIFYGSDLGSAVYNSGIAGYQLPINDVYGGGKLIPDSPFFGLTANLVYRAAAEFNTETDEFQYGDPRYWQAVAHSSLEAFPFELDPITPDPNTPTFIGLPERFSVAVGDPTNPQITFSVDPQDALVAVIGGDGVVTPTGTPGQYTLSITPAAAGYGLVTVRASYSPAPSIYTVRSVHYAASSDPEANSTTRYHTFSSDASAAFALDANYMLVADDEDQVLRIYHRNNSGAPLRVFDYTPLLGLTDRTACGRNLKEVDIEAATSITLPGGTRRIFWLGTLGNEDDGDVPPNRNRLFVTDVIGNNINNYSLNFVGHYDFLREDLLTWDARSDRTRCDGAALPAHYYGLAASAAPGQLPKEIDGFAVEGLAMAPDGTTAYIGFRAPYVPTTTRDRALIVPLLNINGLVGGGVGSAQFGQAIELDLTSFGANPRGIRSMEGNANGLLIVAGAYDHAPNFALFTWNGQCLGQPEERVVGLNDMNVEAIVEIPTGPLNQYSVVQLLSDNGRTVWYDDGVQAKMLPDPFTKFRSDRVSVSIPFDFQEYRLATVSAGNFPAWTFYPFLNGGGSQFYFSTTFPINTALVGNEAPQAVYQKLQPEFSTLLLNNLSPTLAYRVRVHLSSILIPGWQNVSQNVWVSNGGSPNWQGNVNPYASGITNLAMVVDLGTITPNASGQLWVGIEPSAPGKSVIVNGIEVVLNP